MMLIHLVCFSCREDNSQKEAIEALVLQTIEDRLQQYQNLRFKKCREDLLEVASVMADSLLLEEARRSRDTTDKPPVPVKPEQPEIVEVEDTTPVAPFLKLDSLKNDN